MKKSSINFDVLLVVIYLCISDLSVSILSEVFHFKNALTIAMGINILLSVFLIVGFRYKIIQGFSIKKKWLLIVVPVVTVLVVELYDAVVSQILHITPGHAQSNAFQSSPVVLVIAFSTIFAPITEEIIFQQVIQGQILSRIFRNKWVRILLVTILFSLVHGFSWGLSDPKAFVLTCVFYFDFVFVAIVYEYSNKNLTMVIIIHLLTNLIGSISFA